MTPTSSVNILVDFQQRDITIADLIHRLLSIMAIMHTIMHNGDLYVHPFPRGGTLFRGGLGE